MQAVKNKNSCIERLLGKALWDRGWRYRKNDKTVFGKPDFTFKNLKIAVFCDSEYWHGKDWEVKKLDHKSNQDFWIPKIERNIQRDIEVDDKLKRQGWKVLRFWGKDIEKNLLSCIWQIEDAIKQEKMKFVEKISIEEFDSRRFKVRIVEPESNKKALLTHYIHNSESAIAKRYKKEAEENLRFQALI